MNENEYNSMMLTGESYDNFISKISTNKLNKLIN
jgi:hypothetical protein